MLAGQSQAEALPSHPLQFSVSSSRQTFAMCLQAGFEQQLSAAEAALESHSSQGPYFLGDFGYVDLMFMPSLVRVP
jgi:glutathione S-transferase